KRFFTQTALEEQGIQILTSSSDNNKEDQIVIANNAFTEYNIEIKQEQEMGVTFYKYHELLGKWIERYTSVAVTGSHGKTSTTGLLAHVLLENDPISYWIGDGTGKGNVDSQYFAFEACEYKRHFLNYDPDYMIITN